MRCKILTLKQRWYSMRTFWESTRLGTFVVTVDRDYGLVLLRIQSRVGSDRGAGAVWASSSQRYRPSRRVRLWPRFW
jgi:hypothetical protein